MHLLVVYAFYRYSIILPFNRIVELIHGQNWWESAGWRNVSYNVDQNVFFTIGGVG